MSRQLLGTPTKIHVLKFDLYVNRSDRQKTQSALSSISKLYLIRGAFYLLLPGLCAIAFAATATATQTPTVRSSPTPRPRPTPVPRPTPPPSPLLDRSVTFQNNTVHDGFDPASRLVTPLTLKWSRDLSGSGVTSISYPLIVRGLVFVTADTTNNTKILMALDEHTGATIWSAPGR